METLKEKLHSPAFIMYVLYSSIALVFVLSMEKGAFITWLNQKHNPIGNVFFSYITYLGEWHVYVITGVILILYRYYYAILLTIIGVTQLLIIQFLKIFVFNSARPSQHYMETLSSYNLVDGVELYTLYSMPSGHSAAVFALAVLLILLSKNKLIQVVCMLIAIIVTISRVYLFQHFLVDTLVGSTIGLLVAVFIWWYFSFQNKSVFYNNRFLHTGLIFNK